MTTNYKGKKKIYKDKNWLNDQYNKQKKTLDEVAKEGSCTKRTIHYWMEKFHLSRRPLSKAMKGILKGKPSWSKNIKGENHPNWKGGHISGKYRHVYEPDNPRANKKGFIKEHFLVAEKMLGRPLKYYDKNHPNNEIVHHIDGNKLNNKEENLFVCNNLSKHAETHGSLTKILNKIGKALIKKGIIKFNREKGEYYLSI